MRDMSTNWAMYQICDKSGWFNAAVAKYHIGLISTLYVPGSKLLTLGMIILPVIGILIMEIYLPGLITICYKPLLCVWQVPPGKRC